MKKIFIITGLAFLISLSACKPTEKGYQAAYDAAKNKREASISDLGVDLPAGAFQEVDGPQLKTVDGVQVYVLNERLKPETFFTELPGNYNVAIGKYKMITNSKKQAEELRKGGYEAFVAKTSKDVYYTVASSFATLEEAVKFYQELQKDKKRVYVGLPEAPVIIYSR